MTKWKWEDGETETSRKEEDVRLMEKGCEKWKNVISMEKGKKAEWKTSKEKMEWEN